MQTNLLLMGVETHFAGVQAEGKHVGTLTLPDYNTFTLHTATYLTSRMPHLPAQQICCLPFDKQKARHQPLDGRADRFRCAALGRGFCCESHA